MVGDSSGGNRIADCHNHLGKSSSGFSDQTPSDLKKKLSEARVDKAVIFPKGKIEDFTEENRKMSKLDKDSFIPFGRASPTHKNFEEELKQVEKLGLHGLKLHPNQGKFKVNKSLKKDLKELEPQVPILAHTGMKEDEKVHNLEVLSELPNPVIIAHAGKGYAKKAVEFVNQYENFYLDTSLASVYRIKRIVASSPVDKILYGSDSPYSHPAVEKKKILYAVEDEETRRKILGENVLKVLSDR